MGLQRIEMGSHVGGIRRNSRVRDTDDLGQEG